MPLRLFNTLSDEKQDFIPLRPGRVDAARRAYHFLDLSRSAVCRSQHPSTVTGPHGARIAIGQRVPGCQWRYWPWEPREAVGVLWLVAPWGSWAKLTHTSPDADEDEFPVLQAGPRRLWDEVEAACHWWNDAGSPEADRWWFTVSPDEQRVQLI